MHHTPDEEDAYYEVPENKRLKRDNTVVNDDADDYSAEA